MINVARIHQHRQEVTHDHGTVLHVEDAVFVVETDAGQHRARRATSCLLQPAPGDLVLIAVLPRGDAYVLAVLEREEGAPGKLVADGDLSIELRRGELDLAAPEGVRIVAGKEVSLVSATLRVRAADAHVALDRLSFVGTFVRAQVARAKVFGQSLDTFAERVSQRVKRSYRFVEEAEHVRAERLDYAAKGTLSLHGETARVTASRVAKVDGDQVQIG